MSPGFRRVAAEWILQLPMAGQSLVPKGAKATSWQSAESIRLVGCRYKHHLWRNYLLGDSLFRFHVTGVSSNTI